MPRPKRTTFKRKTPEVPDTGPSANLTRHPWGDVFPPHPDRAAYNSEHWLVDIDGRPLYAGIPVDQIVNQIVHEFGSNTRYGPPRTHTNLIQYEDEAYNAKHPDIQVQLAGPAAGRLWRAQDDHGQKMQEGSLPVLVTHHFYNTRRMHLDNPLNEHNTGNTSKTQLDIQRAYGLDHPIEHVSAGRAYHAAAKIEDAWLKQLDRRKQAALQGVSRGRLPAELKASILAAADFGGSFDEIGLARMNMADQKRVSRAKKKKPRKGKKRA